MKAVATLSRSSKGHKRCKYCGEERKFNPNGQTPKERGFDGAKCYECYKKHNAEYQATKKTTRKPVRTAPNFIPLLMAWFPHD